MKEFSGPKEPKREGWREFQELLKQLEAADRAAPPIAEFEARDTQENDLLSAFLRGEITLTEYHARDTRGDKLYPGEVEIPGLNMLYQSLLFLTKNANEARELTDHEGDHLREAIQLGFPDSKILIRFFKEDGRGSLRPAISLILPQSGNEEQIRRNIRTIIEAPEELSDLDREQLK